MSKKGARPGQRAGKLTGQRVKHMLSSLPKVKIRAAKTSKIISRSELNGFLIRLFTCDRAVEERTPGRFGDLAGTVRAVAKRRESLRLVMGLGIAKPIRTDGGRSTVGSERQTKLQGVSAWQQVGVTVAGTQGV